MKSFDELIINVSDTIKEDFRNNALLVMANYKYLNDLGVKDVDTVFKMYYPMFLMDVSNFQGIFNKYDQEDLLIKISKNITIIEHL